MTLIKTQIEIAAPPAVVREKFLQFNQIPKYSPTAHFKSISPIVPNTPLNPGTKVHIELLNGMKFDADIWENSPTAFGWGGTSYATTANHRFFYNESKMMKGGTTFVHEEQFTGLLSFLIGDGIVARSLGWGGEKTKKGFEGFNVDLKAWIEGGK